MTSNVVNGQFRTQMKCHQIEKSTKTGKIMWNEIKPQYVNFVYCGIEQIPIIINGHRIPHLSI